MNTLLEMAQPFSLFLLDAALKSSLLLALLFLADCSLPSAQAAWRNLLWRMGIIGLLLIPAAAALLPVWYVPVAATWSQAPVVQMVVQSVPASPSPARVPTPILATPAPIPVSGNRESPLTPAPSLDFRQVGLGLVAALYLAGLLFFLARLGAGLLSVSRLRRRAVEITDERCLHHLRSLKAHLGLRAPVLLGTGENLPGPTQVGWVHPLILLPAKTLIPTEEDTLSTILAHELAHIRRGDYLFNLVAGLAMALHWFNPVAWLGVNRLRQTSEQACDDWTVEMMGDHDHYARTLVEVATGAPPAKALALGANMATSSRVGQRIERIITLGGRVSPRTSRLAGSLFALALMGGTAMLGVSTLYAKPADAPAAAKPTVSDESGPTAYAIPLSNIQIDGELDDWPQDMIRYPMRTNLRTRGSGDIDGEDLTTSADLSPQFMVGYDPQEHLLYLAVEVRDDVLMTSGPDGTDDCEIFIDSDHSGGFESADYRIPGFTRPPNFYVGIPGTVNYNMYGLESNPGLMQGDITKTRTRMAFARHGDMTTYEWAIQVFNQYPDLPTRLVPGKILGFEVITVDSDQRYPFSVPATISWCPSFKDRSSNPGLFGDLALIQSYVELGVLNGMITHKKDRKPLPGLTINAYRDGQLFGSTYTDAQGHYLLRLTPGEYSLKVKPGQGMEPVEVKDLTVHAGREKSTDIQVPLLKVPEILAQMAAAYRSLQVYHATINAESHMDRGNLSTLYRRQVNFAFGRPNRFRVESSDRSAEGLVLSDGTTLTTYDHYNAQYVQQQAPEKLTVADMQRWVPLIMGLLVPQLLASDDPLAELLEGVESVKEVREETLDGIPVVLVELTKSVLALGPTLPAAAGDHLVKALLWVGTQDHLIHQASYAGPAEAVVVGEEVRVRHQAIEVDPVPPDPLFTFVPPAGARLVDHFPLPGSDDLAKSYPAPAFALKGLDGKEMKLADFSGEVLLLNFWASWSRPCKIELSILDSLQFQYRERGLRVLALSIDEQADTVRSFAKQHSLSFPLVIADAKVQADYGGIDLVPRTLVIDKKGTVRGVYNGVLGDVSFYKGATNRQAQVEQLLAE